ncbi:hypothetical protein HYPSUDRAFT_42794 [Hypholoma sublateritium FD-334 SS-4]|uniref:DNA ligase n=1 Tax=Hypholoma sublateritium (strain FD-334 SS-4) TaxID=945553 RepID=A0A0D2NW73_HYPSF|nr:hypothetical protein HYPSUDRAFT_42794 [Hypholoma sublateritium FD-334 SS-4]
MKKRASSSSVSPIKNKRVKTQSEQPRIDHFFGSPSKVKAGAASSGSPQFIEGSSSSKGVSSKNASSQMEVIDVDALELDQTPPPASNPLKQRAELDVEPPKSLVISSAAHSENRLLSTDFLPLDSVPIDYDPDAQPSNTPLAPYSLLTHALVSLSETRSRIAIINILTNLLRTIISKHPSSLLPAVYLLSNSLGPQFIPIELGLGSSIISHSIQQISGLTSAALKRMYNTSGDPGDVAFAAKSNVRTLIPHSPLTVPYVYESLLKISRCKGQGAGKAKQKIVDKLLLAASGEEVRYLTRTLCQNLRVGAVRTSILTALARAFVLATPGHNTAVEPNIAKPLDTENITEEYKKAEGLIKQVYVKHPSYDQIIPALLEKGLDSLAERVPLAVGIPLLPMLGSPTRSLDEIYDRLRDNQFSAEFKYDGQRAQIHASRTPSGIPAVKIFSRHLEDMTSKYPDVIGLLELVFATSDNLSSFILDAEIVAIDPTTGEIQPFQKLAGRARKDVNIRDVQVAVCVYAFDLMYLNEKPLLERTFRERRDLLRSTFSPRKAPQEDSNLAYFDFVESCESEEGKSSIEEFLLKAVEQRCEGLMVKLLDSVPADETSAKRNSRTKSLPSTYEPDVRTSGWLKLKRDYIDGMSDSLDVIPIGAWHGNGRKAQWWSPVLLALWNPETGRPVALCKCMSGFSDVFYTAMRAKYSLDSDFCSKQPVWECDLGGFKPDVYFKPHEVWELRGADITESPVSVAALGMASSTRGLSLRFPRFIRVREDKSIETASSPSFLVDIWKNQQGKKTSLGGKDEGELLDAEIEESDLELSESDDFGGAD